MFGDYAKHLHNLIVAFMSRVWNPIYAFFAGLAGGVAELYDSLSEYIAKWSSPLPVETKKKRVSEIVREEVSNFRESNARSSRRSAYSASSAPAGDSE